MSNGLSWCTRLPQGSIRLPKAPSSVHLLLRDKASWVEPQIGEGYPKLSIDHTQADSLLQPRQRFLRSTELDLADCDLIG
jgi:hypothetical protein